MDYKTWSLEKKEQQQQLLLRSSEVTNVEIQNSKKQGFTYMSIYIFRYPIYWSFISNKKNVRKL